MFRNFCVYLCGGLLCGSLLFGAKKPEVIDITANSFKSIGNKTTITGDVRIKKGGDLLLSDSAIVFTDSARKPLYYEAIGNVKFVIITTDKRELSGNGGRLVYDVKTNQYKLYDNAEVRERGKSNVLRGDAIVLSGDGEYANIAGNKGKHARVTFTLED